MPSHAYTPCLLSHRHTERVRLGAGSRAPTTAARRTERWIFGEPECSLSEFIGDPELLGRWFTGISWQNWLTILKGAFAEPMDAAERQRFRELAEREPPKRRVRELWCAIGRRGGKDSIASAIATWAATTIDYESYLRPGERAVVLCIAVDRTQAGIVFNYIKGYFERIPMLANLVKRVSNDTIELEHVDVVVATCNYRSIRGKTVALAILDEVSFFRDDNFANPDTEVYAALRPGLTTLREAGAMIVAISTVHRKSGLLYQKWREHHGGDSDILVIRAPSITFNPTLDQAEIEADIALDPARGEAEWLSEWRSDLADYIDRQVVEALVVPGRHELAPLPGIDYHGFCDMSGGSADSSTAAVSHRDSTGIAILDAVREIRAPHSPAAAVAELAQFFKAYKLWEITGDRYAGAFPADLFQQHGGLRYVPSERSKSEIYAETLPLLMSHQVELLDNPRLINQICGLERRVIRGTGRESIDHGVGRQDDLCNSALGALLASKQLSALEIWAALGR